MVPVRMWWFGWAMQVLLHVIRQFRRIDWKGLYIYDLPGVGTSFFVPNVCTRLGFQKVYMPLPRTFFFGHFERSVYDCFVLKHSTLNVTPPTFHKLRDYWKERVLQWMQIIEKEVVFL